MLEAEEVEKQFDRVEAVVIGLLWDGGATEIPGQRHGPEIVRKFSPSLGFQRDGHGGLIGVHDAVTGAAILGGRRWDGTGIGVAGKPTRTRQSERGEPFARISLLSRDVLQAKLEVAE